MAITAKEYREKCGPLAKQMRDIVELASTEDRKLTDEEREKFDRLDAEYTATKDLADRRALVESHQAPEIADEPEERITELVPTPTTIPETYDRQLAIRGWFNERRGVLPEDQLRNSRIGGWHGRDVEFKMPKISHRAPATMAEAEARCVAAREAALEARADTLTDAAGGYTIDEITMSELEKALLSWGSLRQACTVIRTNNGAPLLLPATDDTGNPGELLAETDTAATIDLVFTQVPFGSFMWSSGQIPVTYQLLDDTAINLPAEIGELAGIRLGRVQNGYFTTGTGTAQPTGIVVGSTDSGVVAANATQVTWQELITLKHSVDSGYRMSPKEGFMTSDTGLAAMKKMISETNTPAWQPSLVPGAPDTFDGSRVWVNNDMAVPAIDAKAYIYGDLGKYVIRDVASYIRFLRLDEIQATAAMVVFLAFMRSDGNIRQPAAIKYLAMAAA